MSTKSRVSLEKTNSTNSHLQVEEPFFASILRKTSSKTLAVLQAGRLHNSLSLASVGIIGLFASNVLLPSILPYLLAWTVLFLGIYFINDYFDCSIDTINKPWKPIPSGRLQADTLYHLGILFLIGGALLVIITLDSVGLNLTAGSVAAITSAYLGFEYSRWIKKDSPLFGDTIISLTVAICFLLPWIAGINVNTDYLFSLPIFTIALLGREYLKDLEDRDADIKGSRITFPIHYGTYTTITTAAILVAGSIIWSLYLIFSIPNQGGLRFIPFVLFSII